MTITLSYKPKCDVSPNKYHYPAAAHHYPPSHVHHHHGNHSHAHCYPPEQCPSFCYDGHHYDSHAHPIYHGVYVKAPAACKPAPVRKLTSCDKPSKRKCVRYHYHTHEYSYGPNVYYPSLWFGGHSHYYDKAAHHHGYGYQDSPHHGHHSYHSDHTCHHGYHTGHDGHHGHHTGHHGHSQSYGHGWPYYEY